MKATWEMSKAWDISPGEIFAMGPIVPVLVIHNIDDALPIATALLEGGIKVLEITLRTTSALAIISKLVQELPEAVTGAGTVTNVETLKMARDAGARFLISPGLTPRLLYTAHKGSVPLIPGIATISELMAGIDNDFNCFKFFPAGTNGGPAALKAIAGPFPDITFCPTGGINPDNINAYLQLENVACVGGSWLVTPEIVAAKNWPEITRRTKEILSTIQQTPAGILP
ncbi:MAG: bifunctional 4-hydroxy-2-oxoglutarate aldolase/2-dehydro-3-deoxy-phosphogluconate aldolase [Pseudohongiellaceae bacterium]